MPLARARPAGLHLSGVAYRVFPERTQPVFGVAPPLARALIEQFGRAADLESYLSSTGNTFIVMSEAVLAGLPGELPEQDVVLLAYHAPDLYRNEVAGYYLAQRLPGGPVPCSVTGQGPGGVFTALRIASGMCALGELGRGILFGYDQNAVVWESRHPSHAWPDAAVVLQFGPCGNAAVAELEEVPAGADGPAPAAVLAKALGRHPGARAVAGAGLWAELSGFKKRRVEPAAGLWSTGVWASLAGLWPVQETVLLADYDPVGRRVYTAVLVPDGGP